MQCFPDICPRKTAAVTKTDNPFCSICQNLSQSAFTTGASITATAETATEITSGNFVYNVYTNYAVLKKYTGSAANVTIPAKYGSIPVTEIGYQCFYKNTKLQAVTLPSTITRINNAAFSQCENLTKVIGLRDTKATYIGIGAFHTCKKLDMDYNDFCTRFCLNILTYAET